MKGVEVVRGEVLEDIEEIINEAEAKVDDAVRLLEQALETLEGVEVGDGDIGIELDSLKGRISSIRDVLTDIIENIYRYDSFAKVREVLERLY